MRKRKADSSILIRGVLYELFVVALF
jgi:hypothetical protein